MARQEFFFAAVDGTKKFCLLDKMQRRRMSPEQHKTLSCLAASEIEWDCNWMGIEWDCNGIGALGKTKPLPWFVSFTLIQRCIHTAQNFFRTTVLAHASKSPVVASRFECYCGAGSAQQDICVHSQFQRKARVLTRNITDFLSCPQIFSSGVVLALDILQLYSVDKGGKWRLKKFSI